MSVRSRIGGFRDSSLHAKTVFDSLCRQPVKDIGALHIMHSFPMNVTGLFSNCFLESLLFPSRCACSKDTVLFPELLWTGHVTNGCRFFLAINVPSQQVALLHCNTEVRSLGAVVDVCFSVHTMSNHDKPLSPKPTLSGMAGLKCEQGEPSWLLSARLETIPGNWS